MSYARLRSNENNYPDIAKIVRCVMPALVAFGRKWRIGSDDLVYPYIVSLCTRFLWYVADITEFPCT